MPSKGSSIEFSASLSEVLQQPLANLISIKSSTRKKRSKHHNTSKFVFNENRVVLWSVRLLKDWFCGCYEWITQQPNVVQLHHFTQNQLHILMISIFLIMKKIPKIGENPLIIDLAFRQNFTVFAMCSKHKTIHISRLTILSWTEWYKQFCRNMYGCWDICVQFKYKSRDWSAWLSSHMYVRVCAYAFV